MSRHWHRGSIINEPNTFKRDADGTSPFDLRRLIRFEQTLALTSTVQVERSDGFEVEAAEVQRIVDRDGRDIAKNEVPTG